MRYNKEGKPIKYPVIWSFEDSSTVTVNLTANGDVSIIAEPGPGRQQTMLTTREAHFLAELLNQIAHEQAEVQRQVAYENEKIRQRNENEGEVKNYD